MEVALNAGAAGATASQSQPRQPADAPANASPIAPRDESSLYHPVIATALEWMSRPSQQSSPVTSRDEGVSSPHLPGEPQSSTDLPPITLMSRSSPHLLEARHISQLESPELRVPNISQESGPRARAFTNSAREATASPPHLAASPTHLMARALGSGEVLPLTLLAPYTVPRTDTAH